MIFPKWKNKILDKCVYFWNLGIILDFIITIFEQRYYMEKKVCKEVHLLNKQSIFAKKDIKL